MTRVASEGLSLERCDECDERERESPLPAVASLAPGQRGLGSPSSLPAPRPRSRRVARINYASNIKSNVQTGVVVLSHEYRITTEVALSMNKQQRTAAERGRSMTRDNVLYKSRAGGGAIRKGCADAVR